MNHWDIEAAERQMRDDIVKANTEGDAMIAAGTSDAAFIQAQRQFDEVRLQFILAGMRAENAGLGRNELLSALGFTIGTLYASALSNAVGQRERSVINGWVRQSLAMNIGDQAAAKTIESSFAPMEAGHA